MVNPRNDYLLVREIQLNVKGLLKHPCHGLNGLIVSENDTVLPQGVYFGRVMGGGGTGVAKAT